MGDEEGKKNKCYANVSKSLIYEMTWVFFLVHFVFQTICFDGETIYFRKARNEDRTSPSSRFTIYYNIITVRKQFSPTHTIPEK